MKTSSTRRIPPTTAPRDAKAPAAFAGGEFDLVPGPAHDRQFIQYGRVYPPRDAPSHELRLIEAPLREPRTVQRDRHDLVAPVAVVVAASTPEMSGPTTFSTTGSYPPYLRVCTSSSPIPSYSRADRASSNPKYRVEHSPHPWTSNAVGAPHLPQKGYPTKGRASKHHRHRTSLARRSRTAAGREKSERTPEYGL